VHELFKREEEEIWEALLGKRGEYVREQAKERFHKTKKMSGAGGGDGYGN